MDNPVKQILNLQAIKAHIESMGYGVYPLKSPNVPEHKPVYENIWREHEEAVDQLAESGQLQGFEGFFSNSHESLHQFLNLQEAWVILLPYALESKNPPELTNRQRFGKVAIMSWEWDYHTVMRDEILKALAFFNVSKTLCHLQIDSGPWPERRLAEISGAGKLGRNQMILNESFGGAFYLGILGWRKTDEIAYEAVPQSVDSHGPESSATAQNLLSEYCVSCRKCQRACPAGALIGSYEFLPSRCISALTQMKRELNDNEKKLMGAQLYGCDICQKVCPTNAVRSNCHPRERGNAPEIDVFELLVMSQKDFKRLYGHHGFAWRGLKTIKRNALIHLGNSGDLLAAEFLHRLGNDNYYEGELESVRLWALSRIQERLNHD